MRYRLRTLLLLAMLASALVAAAARCLESGWFADLSGWQNGGYAIEVFAREVSARLLVFPCVFAIADVCVAATTPVSTRLKGFWIVALVAYTMTLWMCNSALLFAQSAS